MTRPRAIVANLDCERELAHLEATARAPVDGRHSKPGRAPQRPPLGRDALRAVAGAATLLRVFARDGDVLWTPGPVTPECVTVVRGLSAPPLLCGELGDLSSSTAVLAWAETPAVATLRAQLPPQAPGRPEASSDRGRLLHEILWTLEPASPHTAARFHDKARALDIAAELGLALPGARRVSALAEVEAHVANGGARASPGGRWVVKARFSAAGRDRLIADCAAPLPPREATRVRRLLAVHGELVFEPWMERQADFGLCGLVAAAGVTLLAPHGLEVDAAGRFRAIRVALDPGDAPALLGLLPEEARALESAAAAVAAQLRLAGFRGPFGIDAWRFRDAAGRTGFHALGEINARMSFGLVARALVERLGAEGELPSGRAFRLVLAAGPGIPPAEPSRRIQLLCPTRASGGAWLEALAAR